MHEMSVVLAKIVKYVTTEDTEAAGKFVGTNTIESYTKTHYGAGTIGYAARITVREY